MADTRDHSPPTPAETPAGGEDAGSLFMRLPIGAYRCAPDGRMLRANPALVRLNGYDSEAQLLAAMVDVAREWYAEPQRRSQFRQLLQRDGEVRAFVSEIFRHRTRDRAWVSENAHMVRGADGQALYYEGTIEDVTDRVHAEQALRDNEQRLQLALESVGDGVWDWDLVHNREHVSPRLLQMYGLGPHEHNGRPDALDDLTHPEDREQMRLDREAHLNGATPAYVNEHRILTRDGQWLWVLSRGMVIERDPGGRPRRMVGTHTDISLRKQAEALRQQQERTLAAQKAQSAFLSRVSHELRTPMNAIIGFAQLLAMDGVGNARQQSWVQNIVGSGSHLLALVDDLLDLSAAQTGQLQFTSTTVDLAALLREAWAMHAADAAAAGLLWRDQLQEHALPVRADPRRLRQVLSNLLSNAIKYNRSGGEVAVSAVQAGDQRVLNIADTGQGMGAEQLARLFQPFERAGAQHGKVSGTGLGLALARQLMESMGGEIGVHSTPGAGSVFSLRLPAA